ncbi:glycosyltransferase [Mesorhizobium huakuii]|uniref:Glycosyltransferase family 4 protein n=1 Tax=Mesorhizobium huakuii TaxID=28104 RepID=A0A7G6SMN3_9HYPH|nr:glycosyltransferase [Mesorhizobium huakuii]QND55765.1 glycosyltransferase family 4 protein [Mesorhizobium huakuii]
MKKLYIDASLPFRWGPHPPVGIPRVETALIRQALRWKGSPVGFFIVDAWGQGQRLDETELRYLKRLVDGDLPQPIGGEGNSYLARLWKVLAIMREAPFACGREFDRVAAIFLSGSEKRRGLRFQLSKTAIRLFKIVKSALRPSRLDTGDPLKDENAICFLSSASVHELAAKKLTGKAKSGIFTLMHDLIPIDFPQFVGPHHARGFARNTAWQLENAQLLVCVSKYTADRVRCHAKASGLRRIPQVAVASPGAFLRESVTDREMSVERQNQKRKFVLYCSTIEIRKNHILLLKVWHRLLPLLGERLPTLVLCGRWGWMYEELTAFMAQHPELAEHVEFRSNLGDRELAELYRDAEFSVYPSAVEGWGLGAAECLDFGLPVLISDAPSLTEATQGLMPTIPARDVEGWCAAVAKACTDPVWLAELRHIIATRYRPIRERAFFATIVDHVAAIDHAAEADHAAAVDPVAGIASDDLAPRIYGPNRVVAGQARGPGPLAAEQPVFRRA